MAKVARAGVGIMLLKNNKVLLGRRHSDPEKADSMLSGEGTWTFPGGKVDFGETVYEAAERELKEETNIEAEDMKIISVTDGIKEDVHFVTIGFLCMDFEGKAKIMEPDEIVEWDWFALDNLPEPIFPPTQKMIERYKQDKTY